MLSFKSFITEGNPLSRLHQHSKAGRHFSVISAERDGLTPQENHARTKELKKKLTSQGYGYKNAEGHWQGGKEHSLLVHAKEKGDEAGNKLKSDMIQHGIHYDQDSVLHHDGKTATLHGTNHTGYPGFNKSENVGRVATNKPKAEFQTELKPGKKSSARFTTTTD
jgi:uncharacterized protein YwqG